MNLKRGDVVVAKLNSNQGQEIGKLRPMVVLTRLSQLELQQIETKLYLMLGVTQ